MGKTTAGLPLRPGEHYEKCPADGTVYRTKRRTRFRCPGCHVLAYAVPTPKGEPGDRRSIEGDPGGRIFRVLAERPAAGAAPPAFGDDVVVYLEDPEAPPPATGTPPGPPPGGPKRRPSKTDVDARRERDRGPAPTGRLSRIWRGSLGDIFRG